MRTGILLPLLLAAFSLHAQNDARLFRPYTAAADSPAPSLAPGVVHVEESTRIKNLMVDYAANKKPLDGYRVQIFLGDRNTAEKNRRAFLLQHPEIPAYLSYLAPNFRVRVGDLRDRVTAEHLREVLSPEFPGLYVVPDQIEPPQAQAAGAAKTDP